MLRVTRPIVLLLLLTLVAAGCGSDGDGGSEKSSGADRTASSETLEKNSTAGDSPESDLEATIDVTIENVADKQFAGVPVPAGIACDKSSPATCRGTIECPAAGDEPDRAKLCGWLVGDGIRALSEEVPENEVCTQQYGGPEVAMVSGSVGATKVDARFSRENGCAIARWDAASPLWTGTVPDADAAPGGGPASGSCPALPPDTAVSNTPEDPAAGAADEVCATPATSTPVPAPGTPYMEPEIISDPPEAFELEK